MSRTKNDEAATADTDKPMTSADRARAFLANKDASAWEDVLGKTPGFHYYIVDLAMKPGRRERMRTHLRDRGYDKCDDVGDSAYSAEITMAEIWRIDDEGFRVLRGARQAHDDEERRKKRKNQR